MTNIQFGKFFIDLNQLKSGIEVDEKNEFLKKYDADGNSIFSMQEIEQLKQDLEKAAGDDKKLDENEAVNLFAQKTGILLEEAKSKFAQLGNIVNNGLSTLNLQNESKEIAQDLWDIIDSNLRVGSLDSNKFEKIFEKVNKDNIIYVLEEYKKASSNSKNESLPLSIIGEITSSSTTQKATIRKLYDLLKQNIDTTKYDISAIEKEFSDLMADNNLFYIDNKDKLDKIFNTMIQMAKGQVVSKATNSETTEVIQDRNTEAEIVSNRKEGAISKFLDYICGKCGGITKENVELIKAKYKEYEAELKALENKPSEYAKKFKEIFGVEYSQEAVSNYKEVNSKYKEALDLANKDSSFDSMFEFELKTKDLDYIYTRHGLKAAESAYNRTYDKLCKILGKEIIDNFLKEQCSDYQLRDCKSKYYVLQNLIQELSAKNKEDLKNVLGDKTLAMMKDERDGAFHAAYGINNDALLDAEKWDEAQQKRFGATQMGVQILAMAGAMFTGGGSLALLSTLAIVADPIGFTEQATDPGGMTANDWKNFLSGRAETLGWMALGIASGGVGAFAANFVKLKGLSSLVSKSGKTLTDLLKNKNLPADIAKQIQNLDKIAKSIGVSTEVALDITTTALLQKEGATTGDWITSLAGAIAGTKFGNDLKKMPDDNAILKLQKTLPDLGITKDDAKKILNKIREINQKVNDWANTPTKSNMMYSSIVPISPAMVEKAAKFVAKIVSGGIEKLFDIINAKLLSKLKNSNPTEYNAVTDMFREITTQLLAGRIPSKEMLNEIVEAVAEKYEINAEKLLEHFDTYADDDGWNVLKIYFKKSEDVNAKKMDEIEIALDCFKDAKGLNMADEVPANTDVKSSQENSKASNENINVSQLFDPKKLNALSKLDEKTYNAVVNVFNTLSKEINSGKVPSKELFDDVINNAVKEFDIDKKFLEDKVKNFMSGAGWDAIKIYLSRPESRNMRNGKINTDVNDAIKYFKRKQGITDEQKINSPKKVSENTTEQASADVKNDDVTTTVNNNSVDEKFEITAELEEKYKYELEQIFYDRESEINLVKLMENYENLTKDIDFTYENIDTELQFLLSQNGITNFDDINTAVKLIKERFHKDILADIQRVKDLGNKYNLSDETIRATDKLIDEIKTKMANGEKINEIEIEEMICNIDARGPIASRIENLLYDNPDIKNYLNDCTHRDIKNNPEIARNYSTDEISEATEILDKIISMIDNDIEFSRQLIEDCLVNVQYSSTENLLYKLIEEHYRLGPLYKNL